MAEKYDPSEDAPETSTTAPTRRDRAQRPSAQRSPARRPAAKAPATTSPARPTRGAAHHVRSFFTVAAVAGLVATVAIPAFAATKTDTAEAVTIQQVAADNAQSLVVASEASPAAFDRGGYSATTPEEIAKVKAEEAAKAALAARVAARSASSSSSSFAGTIAQSIAASGEVVRPLTSFNNFGTPYAGHKGTDYMADRGTPIYSIADGVVVASTESGPGWGVYVKIAHNIGGTSVTSLYAHMLYGSRQVQVGDTVHAGQLLGQVSDTGRAFGTHLHLEIYVNGAWTNAESWLQANAR